VPDEAASEFRIPGTSNQTTMAAKKGAQDTSEIAAAAAVDRPTADDDGDDADDGDDGDSRIASSLTTVQATNAASPTGTAGNEALRRAVGAETLRDLQHFTQLVAETEADIAEVD
jgi:hypothetical protein